MDEGAGYARAKTLFLEASRLPREERTRFLKAQCGIDATLEARVRRLLTHDERSFLETPIMGAIAMEGTRLGAFSVLRLLGEGGMGVVYEAQQHEPDRRVALKLIRPGLFSDALRERFRHEIQVLGQLRHPGVAQIYEAGTLVHAGEHVPYFAMELVEGQPLLQASERLSTHDRLALIAQICDAVHHAHQKGVIHRDLKPGNILVEEAPTVGDGTTAIPFQVKVLDFGVARAVDARAVAVTFHTQVGQIVGTLQYLSPEQAAGDPDAMDIRSDVYSIGVIACEVLTRRLPYDVLSKPLTDVVRIIREQDPLRLGTVECAFKGDVETIVGKALQKDRSLRYQSAAELAADIRRYLRSEPILARAPSALYQIRKFAQRNRPLVLAAATVLLAMAVATGVSVWQARVATNAKKQARQAAQESEREAKRATLAGAAAAIASGDPITAVRLLDRTPESQRGWAWQYWNARLDECVGLVQAPGPIVAATLSSDGRDVTVLTADGVLRRGSMESGEWMEIASLAETPVRAAAFTDQGRRVITDGPDRHTLTLFDATDGRVIHRHDSFEAPIGTIRAAEDNRGVLAGLRRPGQAPSDVLWLLNAAEPDAAWTGTRIPMENGTEGTAISASGQWLALGGARESVVTWDSQAPALRRVAQSPRGAQAIAISQDGSRIATGGVNKTINIWDRESGRLIHSLTGHTGTVTALAFDPAGATLASAGVDLTIRLWNTADGHAIATLVGQVGTVDQLQFCADGSILMSASREGAIRAWRRDPYEGTCILRGHTSYVYAIQFSQDGSRILSGAWDGSLRAWNADDGRELATEASKREYVTAIGQSRDGSVIAAGRYSGRTVLSSIDLWDAAGMRPLHEISAGRGELGDLVFSEDGSRLYVGRQTFGVDEYDLSTNPAARREVLKGNSDGIALAPGGKELACGFFDGSISIVSVASGEVTRRLQGHTHRVRGVAFHPTLPILASASDDGTARLWDLATGKSFQLRGHADKVYCVAFSPDGRLLATGSEDTSIVIWELRDPSAELGAEELTRLRGHDAYVYSVAFSPDGTRLASGSGDHTVRIWDTRPVRERWRGRSARP